MKWINHSMITFTSCYLFSHSMRYSFLISIGSVAPDILDSSLLKPLFFKRPQLPHTPIFWIPLLILTYFGIKLFLSTFPIDFLPTPGTIVWLVAAGIGSHLFLDAFSNSPIILPGGKKIALECYETQTPSEDLFTLFCLIYVCMIKCMIKLVMEWL